jgi:hypothetical protein
MVSEGVRELLWLHQVGNGREMTIGGDEGDIKYPLSPTVTAALIKQQRMENCFAGYLVDG